MNARKLLLVAVALVGLSRGAGAQRLPDPDSGRITIFLPVEWTGPGTRGMPGITVGGVRVEGLAFHPSGIARVTVAGNPAAVSRDPSGATRFRVQIPPEAARRDVEIVAFPVEGLPLVRVQHTDGTFITRTGDVAAPAAGLDALAPVRLLRVHLAGSSAALAARVRMIPAVLVDRRPDAADLSVGSEGGWFHVTGRDGAIRHRVPGAEELAAVLAREAGALQLAAVAPPADAFPLEFEFAGGDTFPLGSAIEFRVRSSLEGYLTVIDLGTDGTLGVLFPVLSDDPRIRAGDEVLLPSRTVRSYFAPDAPYRATAPTGLGLVRAFVTRRPVILPSPGAQGLEAGAVLRALRDAMGGPAAAEQVAWSTALLTYHVVPN